MRTAVERGRPSRLRSNSAFVYWFRADKGIGAPAGSVNAWTSQVNPLQLSQGTALNQPTKVANGLNGRPTISADGITQWLFGTVAAAAPFHVFFIGKITAQSAVSNHDTIFSLAASAFLIVDTTPRSIMADGTNLTYNGIVANARFARVECMMNSTNSKLVEDDMVRASGNAGTTATAGLTLFSLSNGIVHTTTAQMGEFLLVTRVLNVARVNRLKNYQKAWYRIP